MMTANETRVNVNRLDLIRKLKKNMAVHVQDHNEAVIGYQIKLQNELRLALDIVELSTAKDLKTLTPVSFSFPVSYEGEYIDAITMLEWEVNEVICLDQRKFKQYVQNNWDWSRNFEVMSTAYKAYASSGVGRTPG